MKHLPKMLSLGAVKFKRHKSSRYLPEFNAVTNALLSGERKKASASASGREREA